MLARRREEMITKHLSRYAGNQPAHFAVATAPLTVARVTPHTHKHADAAEPN
jgi:hypothetical protein